MPIAGKKEVFCQTVPVGGFSSMEITKVTSVFQKGASGGWREVGVLLPCDSERYRMHAGAGKKYIFCQIVPGGVFKHGNSDITVHF
jgi:hypothetical protein